LKQDYVRKGRRTIKGFGKDALNSAKRYYLNIFEDSSRLRGVNLLTGCDKEDSLAGLSAANNEEEGEEESSGAGLKLTGGDDGDMAAEDESTVPETGSPAIGLEVVKEDKSYCETRKNESGKGLDNTAAIINSQRLDGPGGALAAEVVIDEATILASIEEGFGSGRALNISNNTATEVEVLLTARTSRVIAALDDILRVNRALLESQSDLPRAVKVKLRTGATPPPPAAPQTHRAHTVPAPSVVDNTSPMSSLLSGAMAKSLSYLSTYSKQPIALLVYYFFVTMA
jgi:hypothetical protein